MSKRKMPPDRDAPSGGANYIRLYSNLLATIEPMADTDRLGELFTTLRASGDAADRVFSNDPDVQRMLVRIGVIAGNGAPEVLAKLTEEFIRKTAEALSRTPSHVSVVLRLYATGMYGVLPKPVCGAAPRCRDCGITKDCDYFNAPERGRRQEKLSPARRLARDGAEALSDEDILMLLLGASRAGERERETVRMLLTRFGSLRGVMAATYGELAGLRDVTESVAVRLSVASALHGRLLLERRADGPTMRCGKDFYDLYYPTLRDLKQETFIVILMDQKNRVLRDERVSQGTLTSSLVHPREVFAPAIRESAAAVAFVHNHPSGDSAPSPEDIALTRRLVKTAQVVGIRVLDHVIVGEGVYTSFVDEGLLENKM